RVWANLSACDAVVVFGEGVRYVKAPVDLPDVFAIRRAGSHLLRVPYLPQTLSVRGCDEAGPDNAHADGQVSSVRIATCFSDTRRTSSNPALRNAVVIP